ncbi:uncharacterized protein SRS1_16500 [Sporisorium reilianum f. sp. reilianum]|uniref:Uncharacterized protein n=1 Tax=Sporisorium reilianum f. sp. reilianum TaxID=72559 RepID=A0A2N8UM07_9BASI|nr:uncharacterized protein SRS1_16500 [Sporisorium reilianum f. sp. reilianum]
MQSPPFRTEASGRSPRSSGLPSSSRIIQGQYQQSDQPSSLSPSRVVVAEGSEFVLQALPIRASPSAHRLSSIDRRVSAPHLPASPSQLASSSQSRAVSATSTPLRSRQSDRPYRPPPSSSARFYERQQQRWMLQQPSVLPHIPAQTSALLYSQSTQPPHPSNPYQPSATSSPPYAQPAALPYSSATAEEQQAIAVPSRSGSDASAVSRLRSTSVSSLAPPETKNRARSGSDAGSFTRSCISNGYNSNTDDEYVDLDPIQRRSAANRAHSAWQAPGNVATDDQDDSFLPSNGMRQNVDANDTLGDSGDADWDAELGISEADHAEPLRLPSLQQAEHLLHPSPIITGDAVSSASSNIVTSKLAVSSPGTSTQQQPHIESIKAADLKGIRVTCAVSESWDGDFLFQNDEDPVDAESQYGGNSKQRGSREQRETTRSSSSKLLHSQDDQGADSDDDVENWDDAFAWNADSIMTPSASTSSSLHDLMLRSNVYSSDLSSTPTRATRASTRELPLDAARRVDFGGNDKAHAKKRLSNGSSTSNITDFSARLAAQSDADSFRQRSSQGSNDFSLPQSRQRNALGLVQNVRKDYRNTTGRSDDSGDETETDSPAKEIAAPLPARPARRSLGAALGFDTRRKSAAKEASTAVPSPSRVTTKTKDDPSLAATKSHARSQSKSKLGALQRLSFSRSRLSVANASSTSVHQMLETGESPQRPYADNANQSQASLLSHASTNSSRSRRGASPSSLERSYTALRSTSFRRFLGRGDKNGAAVKHDAHSETPPPSSLPRRGSEQSPPMLPISSPQRHTPTAHAPTQPKSPPFSWTGIRRSIEVTPKRQKEQASQRDSDSFQRDSPGQPLFAQANSPSMSPTALGHAMQQRSTSLALLQGKSDPSATAVERPVLDPKESGLLPAAGLRRDFSSSNTLRAGPSIDASTPTRSGRSKPDAEASTRRWRAAAAELGTHAQTRSDGTSTDVPPSSYGYGGINMSRGPDGHGSASRSVSASTAHSHTSAESMYGYRMRQQISVSSGPEAQDSETSYGTSVGSSPGLTGQWSWISSGKRGANPSTDTKDTAWMASVDLPERQELSTRQDVQHGRAASVPGSPLTLETTLDGEPILPHSQAPRKQSAPDTSLSPSYHPDSVRGGAPTHLEAPLIPSQPASPGSLEPSRVLPASPNTDASVAGMPSSSQAPSSSSAASSSRKGAPRRNSLSDLKIPSRISKAQTGIRNNISLVRDFARGIEELKVLKASYMDHKVRTPLAPSDVEERVQNWLECADVLIGLGEGRSEADATARVDTLSHTPLSAHVDTRRTTFSDASIHASPASPLDGWTSRQSSVSSARSASGTSQATTSTTDGVRSVDVHREIDILSAILGGHKLTASQTEVRPHARFQSDPYTRDEVQYRNAAFASTSTMEGSDLTTPDRESLDMTRNGEAAARAKPSERPFNTAPALSHANASSAEVAVFDGVDVGDANRSAKRRLRSASRAGLQGLRDLLRVFKGTTADDATAASAAAGSKTGGMAETADATTNEQQPRYSIDGRPSTPSATKQKRKSINLKRRSFLRSRTSLESVSAKAAEGQTTQEAAPPLPVSPDGARYTLAPSSSSSKVDRRRPDPSLSKSSLDITWEAGSADRSRDGRIAQRSASATSKAVRRISLQSALSGSSARRQSVDLASPGLLSSKATATTFTSQQHSTLQQHRRPSLAVRPITSTAMTPPDPRRASTSVDAVHRHHQLLLQQGLTPARATLAPGRPHSSTSETPHVVQKLALRPEAMPGLLVYVQATKQHLQAAIDELGSQQAFALR